MLALTVLRVLPYHGRGATIWERRDGPFFSRAVLWDPVDFSEENLRSFSGELAQEMKGNLAWDVGVFVDRSDLTRELYGKMVTDQGYEWWQKLYIKFGQSLLPMAEFFGYENNIVMRLRDNAGNCSEVTLQGHDFLRVNRDDIEFEILKILYHPLPPNVSSKPGDEAEVTAYVRASQFPSAQQAKEFSRILQKNVRQKRVDVEIRTDTYFIDSSAFPILYRFDQKPAPPSLEEYQRSRTMFCFGENPGIPCR